MIWCELYLINIDIDFNCKNKCVLWKKDKCNYPTWKPALKRKKLK